MLRNLQSRDSLLRNASVAGPTNCMSKEGMRSARSSTTGSKPKRRFAERRKKPSTKLLRSRSQPATHRHIRQQRYRIIALRPRSHPRHIPCERNCMQSAAGLQNPPNKRRNTSCLRRRAIASRMRALLNFLGGHRTLSPFNAKKHPPTPKINPRLPRYCRPAELRRDFIEETRVGCATPRHFRLLPQLAAGKGEGDGVKRPCVSTGPS